MSIERLIPEKTLEIWTAFSLIDHLGPETWIWSWAHGADQEVWDDGLGKWFMLELKAPLQDRPPALKQNQVGIQEMGPDSFVNVDVKQLNRYVTSYRARQHPDVLYVFPSIPWHYFQDNRIRIVMEVLAGEPWLLPSRDCQGCFNSFCHCFCPFCNCQHPYSHSPLDPLARPCVRRSYPSWAYVVRATELHRALQSNTAKTKVRVRCFRGEIEFRGSKSSPSTSSAASAPTLCSVLRNLSDCTEDPGTALRSRRARRTERPVTGVSEMEEDLFLEEGSINRALNAIGEGRPGHLLLVGMP